MDGSQTAHLQRCLDRLRAGDESARPELLAAACERLTRLTRAMLRDYPRLKRWEETGDVLQNALVRLHRALQQVTPASPRDFYRLATLQIRRELIDLARHHYGPEGAGGHHESVAGRRDESDSRPPAHEPADAADAPGRLAEWAEFHEQAEALPEEEREVFDLVWYQGLTHADAAAVLGVSTKTVQRRWHAACLKLHDRLGGELPGL
jgi:RNA polymerase sigma-70 factor (ECF subfamily)